MTRQDEHIVQGVLDVLALIAGWRVHGAAVLPTPQPPPEPCELFNPEYDRYCGDFDRRRRAERITARLPGQLALPLNSDQRSA